MRKVIALCLVILSGAGIIYGQGSSFTADIDIQNLSDVINDGVITVNVNNAEPPLTYKWSNQDTKLTSAKAEKLTEGKYYSVMISDSNGDTLILEDLEVPTQSIDEMINSTFTPVVSFMEQVLFFDIFAMLNIYDPTIRDDDGNIMYHNNGDPRQMKIPFIVIWLILGATFFTLKMRFINFRGFGHAIGLIRGKYDDPDNKGEVSHFQALTTALSATVGLGNIAGVAIAITLGGPGATFWMIIAGLLGMSSKFTECTLGLKYRKIDGKGEVSGGAMYYLDHALSKKNLKWLGKVLAIVFAILVIGGSFGGGNMFQANQAFSQLSLMAPGLKDYGWVFGIIIAVLVGIVIIGGIKSIAKVTDKIVPFMAVLYVATALAIICINITEIDDVFVLIFEGAFNAPAIKGGIIGVLIVGFQRAAFSNEAGVGSASIAHSAAKTEKPVSEGIVALLEPFIDTVVICTMTALVVIFTGYHNNTEGLEGAQLTSSAFGSVFSWFPYLLVVAVMLFAFSTMISWSYYGLKGFNYLFGGFFEKKHGHLKVPSTIYRLIFLGFVIVGASSNLGSVLDFSDMMILSMAFPNILGLYILSSEVRSDLKEYWRKLKSGEIVKFK